MSTSSVRIEPWGEGDLPLLQKRLGDPAMMEHLGGPMSPESIVERQGRYERLPGTGKGQMFRIVDAATGEGVGSVGYWERESSEGLVYEGGKYRFLYAYPSVDNAPSNAICRKLGFALVHVSEYEYPPDSGNILRCNDWGLDLFADG